MQTLAQKIKEKQKTTYQIIADKFNTHPDYVSKIACGARKPTRGKGLEIKKELQKIANN